MGEKPKRYCLYLDESGTFGEGPGGVFFDESVRRRAKPRDILAQIAQDPDFLAARRAGVLCQKLGKTYAKAAQAYFLTCESLCFRPGQDTLYAIGLACMAERILADLRNGKRVDTLERQLRDRCAEAERRVQIPELQEFFRELVNESSASADKKKFYQSVSDRVGH